MWTLNKDALGDEPAPKSQRAYVRKLRPGSYGVTVTFAVAVNTVVPLV